MIRQRTTFICEDGTEFDNLQRAEVYDLLQSVKKAWGEFYKSRPFSIVDEQVFIDFLEEHRVVIFDYLENLP